MRKRIVLFYVVFVLGFLVEEAVGFEPVVDALIHIGFSKVFNLFVFFSRITPSLLNTCIIFSSFFFSSYQTLEL